ncbi:MAG TPA: signal peptidase II, partial [Dermatophilaceae bacterium]|nr:signal peptidase II [Dermatophilaceae bacterium]
MQAETGAALTDAPPDPDAPAAPGGWSRLHALLLTCAAIVLVADQGTKAWALANLEPGEPRDLVGSFLRLNLIRNPGAAFSIGEGVTWLLTLVALAVLVWVALAARRLGSLPWAVALGLVLGGSVGNLADRLLREPGPGRGHVVDFLDYGGLFIGNVADIAIVTAAALVAVLTLRGVPVTGPP